MKDSVTHLNKGADTLVGEELSGEDLDGEGGWHNVVHRRLDGGGSEIPDRGLKIGLGSDLSLLKN